MNQMFPGKFTKCLSAVFISLKLHAACSQDILTEIFVQTLDFFRLHCGFAFLPFDWSLGMYLPFCVSFFQLISGYVITA